MHRVSKMTVSTVALLIALVPFARGAAAQQHTLKEQVVGTWKYVAVDVVRSDGSRVPLYGPNPRGVATFDNNGNYMLLTARASLPKFAANDRTKGTAD